MNQTAFAESASGGTPRPLKMGGLEIAFPVALAPMAGYTDAAFRSICVEMGCGMTLTELASAAGLARGSGRTLHLLETGAGERPAGAHIYGAEPDVMAAAAAGAERLGRFDFVDVNAGCPVRKIVVRGAGVALIADPARLERVVRAMARAVRMPVTVKTRVGLDPERENVAEIAAAAEQGGAAALFLHARFASSKHGGPPRWDLLARAKAACRIPVIGNGGIETAADVPAMLAATGVDGVMIGRAALGNPWLFAEVRALLSGGVFEPPTPAQRRLAVLEHLRRLIALAEKAHCGRRRPRRPAGEAAVLQFRAHLLKYVSGADNAGAVRRGLEAVRSAADVEAAAALVFGRGDA